MRNTGKPDGDCSKRSRSCWMRTVSKSRIRRWLYTCRRMYRNDCDRADHYRIYPAFQIYCCRCDTWRCKRIRNIRNVVDNNKKGILIKGFLFLSWKSDLNRRPLHYEWSALPTELFQHTLITGTNIIIPYFHIFASTFLIIIRSFPKKILTDSHMQTRNSATAA